MRHGILSSPRWSVRAQNIQPWKCFKDHCAAYTHLVKVSSAKYNSEWKLKDSDRWVLKRIVTQKRKTTLPEITSEINTHLNKLISMTAIQRGLRAASIHVREAVSKPLVSMRNAKKRLQWW
ncbi:transposable element Tc1 transposase [Trichonephila clavipes]|nr:transposable element Tc1 transposase [Trichonephila clavipes]